MVTMEDALEEIVGEIYDEHDTPGDNDLVFIEKEDGSYIVDGEYFVEDLFERLNIGDIPEDIPSKLSGWLFAKCESIPQVGFKYDGYKNSKNPWFISYDFKNDKWENVSEKYFKERKSTFDKYKRFDYIPLKSYK